MREALDGAVMFVAAVVGGYLGTWLYIRVQTARIRREGARLQADRRRPSEKC